MRPLKKCYKQYVYIKIKYLVSSPIKSKMKKTLLTAVISFILVLTSTHHACAGFATAKHSNAQTTTGPTDTKVSTRDKKQVLIAEIKNKLKNAFSFDQKEDSKHKKSSWQAFVSFGCSMLGFILMIAGFLSLFSEVGALVVGPGALSAIVFGILCGIAGIVFGIKGVKRRKHKFRGFALAGIILGSIDLFFLLVLVLIAAAFG